MVGAALWKVSGQRGHYGGFVQDGGSLVHTQAFITLAGDENETLASKLEGLQCRHGKPGSSHRLLAAETHNLHGRGPRLVGRAPQGLRGGRSIAVRAVLIGQAGNLPSGTP